MRTAHVRANGKKIAVAFVSPPKKTDKETQTRLIKLVRNETFIVDISPRLELEAVEEEECFVKIDVSEIPDGDDNLHSYLDVDLEFLEDTVDGLVAARTPIPDDLVATRTPTSDGFVASRTPNEENLVAARSPNGDELVAPRAHNKDDLVAARTPNKGDLVAARTPNKDDLVAARTPNKDDIVAARTPNKDDIVAARTPNKDDIVAARTPNKDDLVAARTPNKDDLVAARTPNKDDLVAARTPNKDDLVAARTPNKDDLVAARTPNKDDLVAARTPNKDDLVAARTPTPYPLLLPPTDQTLSLSSAEGVLSCCDDESVSEVRLKQDGMVDEDTKLELNICSDHSAADGAESGRSPAESDNQQDSDIMDCAGSDQSQVENIKVGRTISSKDDINSTETFDTMLCDLVDATDISDLNSEVSDGDRDGSDSGFPCDNSR